MVLLLAISIYVRYFRKKNAEESKLPSKYIVVDKSPKFSYEELANATDNFSLANKIGQGGFGEVYYGEPRDKVCYHSIVSFTLH